MKVLRQLAANNFMVLCAALLCSPSAAALNLNAYAEHPVRVIVGVAALILALGLTLFTILRDQVKKANRQRSYGSGMRYGAPTASHKTAKKGKRRYGKPSLAMFFPRYRGRKQKTAQARPPRVAQASRHRKIRGRTSRYGGSAFTLPAKGYSGGKSRATSAVILSVLPNSHRKKQSGSRRYGSFTLPAVIAAYRGGGSVAQGARFESTRPVSHRGRGRPSRHYGGKLLAKPVRNYKGGGSVAKGARFESTMPLSHRGKVRLKNHYGGKFFTNPVRAYKGGGSVAKGARFESTMPLSHRGRIRLKNHYGGKFFTNPVRAYKGGGSVAKGALF